jgi:ubiquinone/menaquinone biosynthesis C-methylase UbiE
MIKKTLEIIYQLRGKGERGELATPYITWSARSLVSIKEQQSARNLAVYMVGKGGYDNFDYIFLLDVLKSNADYSREKILTELSQIDRVEKENENDKKTKFMVIALTDLIGAEEAVKKINEIIVEHKGEENVQNNLRYTRTFIVPNHTKVAIENLQKFYQEDIKFEEYKINEKMNAQEVMLLKSLINKNEKTLEMGCGTGRLIGELAKEEYDISGFDITPKHVDITRKKLAQVNAKGEIFEGDWHNIKEIKDNSLDVAYSLGRNILHDYSISDQVQLFREAARILKPGGKFIFDIANRGVGGYKKMVDGYAQEMKKRGIKNFRYGSIYDSPDGKNFTIRYAYSNEDIEDLAKISGFRILKIEKRKLETDADDENLYYVLEKI